MPSAAHNPRPPAPVDVLIVDSDPVTAATTQSAVDAAGLSSVHSYDVAGFKRAVASPVSTVVLELMLDNTDGIELIRYFAGMIAPPDLIIFSSAEPRIRDAAARLASARGVRVRGILGKSPAGLGQLERLLRETPNAHTPDRDLPTFMPSASDLRHGMANGEISVLFQPKINVTTLELISVEALARWIHPTHGPISPGDFVSVAEYHGLIGPLTEIVVHSAFDSARHWRELGYDFRLSFNVSGASLANLMLPDRLAEMADEYGLSTQRITVEITEGWIEQNPIDALDIMTRLRMKGFDLSIDDFGTGYSTMLRLRQVPFSELKLDQSLIRGAARDEVARKIVASSIELGRSLGLHVVAEGVDNQADWDLIVDLGCDEGQGYFIARPMDADTLAAWHQHWRSSLGL